MMVHLHPSRHADLKSPERVRTTPEAPLHSYLDGFGNVCTRVVAPAGRFTITNEFLIEDSGRPDPISPDAIQHPVEDLPDECLVYLLGSRYCETDLLADFAWNQFGGAPTGWARVQAIVEWTHNHIRFGYEYARPTKTAFDAFREGQGVCRDYAHLAIALCRCMNIPARYCTGYLGDIGIQRSAAPMDFSGWFDVYLGGAWHTFDARHNKPRIGRLLMARGRDATDAAITTQFGAAPLSEFVVVTEEIAEPAQV
jgi:transglutaminase-like putative cysteine protease